MNKSSSSSHNSDLKKDLRLQALRQRRQIDISADDADNLIHHFDTHIDTSIHGDDDAEGRAIVSLYWPTRNEMDITPLIAHLHKNGVKCALPKVIKDLPVLQFAPWTPESQMVKGPLGIFEPDTDITVLPDIVVVPLLAFDRRGHRLGYGGGYYDRTLYHLKQSKNILSVGVAHDQQICLFPLPDEDHDEVLDWVITPTKVYKFKT